MSAESAGHRMRDGPRGKPNGASFGDFTSFLPMVGNIWHFLNKGIPLLLVKLEDMAKTISVGHSALKGLSTSIVLKFDGLRDQLKRDAEKERSFQKSSFESIHNAIGELKTVQQHFQENGHGTSCAIAVMHQDIGGMKEQLQFTEAQLKTLIDRMEFLATKLSNEGATREKPSGEDQPQLTEAPREVHSDELRPTPFVKTTARTPLPRKRKLVDVDTSNMRVTRAMSAAGKACPTGRKGRASWKSFH